MKTVFSLFLALCLAGPAFGNPLPDPGSIKSVHVVGPSWAGFTNKDGTGLYHEILTTLFALYGIEYQRDYVPSERAYHLVRDNLADFMTCHDKAPPQLLMAKHPMFEGQFHVFFNKANIGPWSVPQSLEGRSIAWRIGYYEESNIPAKMQVKVLNTGVSALGMVILGRIDFYLDDLNFINDSLSKNKIRFNMDDFRIEPIGKRSYRPIFNATERGKKIMELYDRGMEHLFKTGKLRDIFQKWGHPLPLYDID